MWISPMQSVCGHSSIGFFFFFFLRFLVQIFSLATQPWKNPYSKRVLFILTWETKNFRTRMYIDFYSSSSSCGARNPSLQLCKIIFTSSCITRKIINMSIINVEKLEAICEKNEYNQNKMTLCVCTRHRVTNERNSIGLSVARVKKTTRTSN